MPSVFGDSYLYVKHIRKYESIPAKPTPKLGLTQPVFCNSYFYVKHIRKYESVCRMSTPKLGLVQPVFGNG
jgi:hypothetical protein